MGMVVLFALESSSDKDNECKIVNTKQMLALDITVCYCWSSSVQVSDRSTNVQRKGSQIRFDENQEEENN